MANANGTVTKVCNDEVFTKIAHKIENNLPELYLLLQSTKNVIEPHLIRDQPIKLQKSYQSPVNADKSNKSTIDGRPPTIDEIDHFFQELDNLEMKIKPKIKRSKQVAKLSNRTTLGGKIGEFMSNETIATDIDITNVTVTSAASQKSEKNSLNSDNSLNVTPLITMEMINEFEAIEVNNASISDQMERDQKMFEKLDKDLKRITELFVEIQTNLDKKEQEEMDTSQCFIDSDFVEKLSLLSEILASIQYLEENRDLYTTNKIEPVILPLHESIVELLQKISCRK